ncbi:PREDICTED: uncharacterized protein LOC105598917 [Cercocebus atys]|uniref:uncharacterized protein LOC105598917 n=1 Tax=Cercocebus atys TaxID=9531 RepID=UPI0005F564EA|nr:PREDICTED: uncharacterized protein LOC105598917 [Cercocebus atys]
MAPTPAPRSTEHTGLKASLSLSAGSRPPGDRTSVHCAELQGGTKCSKQGGPYQMPLRRPRCLSGSKGDPELHFQGTCTTYPDSESHATQPSYRLSKQCGHLLCQLPDIPQSITNMMSTALLLTVVVLTHSRRSTPSTSQTTIQTFSELIHSVNKHLPSAYSLSGTGARGQRQFLVSRSSAGRGKHAATQAAAGVGKQSLYWHRSLTRAFTYCAPIRHGLILQTQGQRSGWRPGARFRLSATIPETVAGEGGPPKRDSPSLSLSPLQPRRKPTPGQNSSFYSPNPSPSRSRHPPLPAGRSPRPQRAGVPSPHTSTRIQAGLQGPGRRVCGPFPPPPRSPP